MLARDYVVYRLSTRPVRENCNSNSPWCCRLGPCARGSLPKRMVAPKYVTPATRKVSPREIIQILGNSSQIEYPASMKTDACLGNSVMGYQSWDVVHNHSEAWMSILVRLEGRLSKGHVTNAKDGLCQKAKVGYIPRCDSLSYLLGALGPRKQMEVRLWAAFGPWAPRRLAAIEYSW